MLFEGHRNILLFLSHTERHKSTARVSITFKYSTRTHTTWRTRVRTIWGKNIIVLHYILFMYIHIKIIRNSIYTQRMSSTSSVSTSWFTRSTKIRLAHSLYTALQTYWALSTLLRVQLSPRLFSEVCQDIFRTSRTGNYTAKIL